MDCVMRMTVATRGGASFDVEAVDPGDVKSLMHLYDRWQRKFFKDDEMVVFDTKRPRKTEMSVLAGEIAFIAVTWRWSG